MNKHQIILQDVINSIIITSLVYGMISFIVNDANATNWEAGLRFLFVFVSLAASGMTALIRRSK